MAQAVAVSRHLPVALQGPAMHVSSSAFIHALHAASAVGAAVALAGSLLAVVCLGGRMERTARLEPAIVAVSA